MSVQAHQRSGELELPVSSGLRPVILRQWSIHENACSDHTGTGNDNTGIGAEALYGNGSGAQNTALGRGSLGKSITGNNNIGIGFNSGSKLLTGNDNIYIASPGAGAGESSTIRIGSVGRQSRSYIAGISGVTVADGVAVVVDSQGQLGTLTSSARYKEDIKPMANSSENILSLKPVTFRYKKDLDPNAIPQFGLVAEDVAKVDPALVAKDNQGNPYTVRYEAVNAMLLNEFLKEHKKVEEQAGEIKSLQDALQRQANQMQEFAAHLDAKGL